MSIRQTLSAAIMLTIVSGHAPVAAEDYIVEIGGTEGTQFGGTCLLVNGDGHANRDANGTVPLALSFSADVISCAIQRKSGGGSLHILIKTTSGRFVAQSSTQPFGVVMAGGR